MVHISRHQHHVCCCKTNSIIIICLVTLFLMRIELSGAVNGMITINGGWSPWSTVATPCSRMINGVSTNVTCGGGIMKRRRSCTNPEPQGFRPKKCEGEEEKNFTCAEEACDMKWSEWSECSAYCGRGSRRRKTMCSLSRGGESKLCKDLNLKDQDFEHIQDCNTWNRETCPSPCEGYACMEMASCVDISTDEDPYTKCVCQLGRVMNEEEDGCIIPLPTTPTPRPDPSLPPAVKLATTAVTSGASTVLIIFVGFTLFLFLWLKVKTVARVIQMNMEIALICAHVCLIFAGILKLHEKTELGCKIMSIVIHFFFTATFMFMLLEAIHTYSLVAFVVKKNGMLTKAQNVIAGWLLSIAVILIVAAIQYENYGGDYHCWLRIDTPLSFGQIVPTVILVILIFTVLEAAGAADYRKLPGLDQDQYESAKIMQRSNLVIMPLVFISWMIGAMSEYEQDVGLYSVFTILNAVLGVTVFLFHCSGNEDVREKLEGWYDQIIKRK